MKGEPRHISILLVEDDPVISRTLKLSFGFKGLDVMAAPTFKVAVHLLEQFQKKTIHFDAVVLDINLPDGSGLELCRHLRTMDKSIPVIMLTAHQAERDAVECLSAGADDYVRKPFGVNELEVRIIRLCKNKYNLETLSEKLTEKLTEKSSEASAGKIDFGDALKFGSIKISVDRHLAWIHDKQIKLGKREFDILNLLVKKSGEVVRRDEFLNLAENGSNVFDRTIDSHLSHLRKKLGEFGALDVLISPVYGVGYRLEMAP